MTQTTHDAGELFSGKPSGTTILGYSEPSIRRNVKDTEGFKDLDLMLFDKVIAFDNFRQKRQEFRNELILFGKRLIVF